MSRKGASLVPVHTSPPRIPLLITGQIMKRSQNRLSPLSCSQSSLIICKCMNAVMASALFIPLSKPQTAECAQRSDKTPVLVLYRLCTYACPCVSVFGACPSLRRRCVGRHAAASSVAGNDRNHDSGHPRTARSNQQRPLRRGPLFCPRRGLLFCL